MMGMSEQFIRIGLQRGILPIGTAVQISTRYTYHISPKLLAEYLGEQGYTTFSQYSKLNEV